MMRQEVRRAVRWTAGIALACAAAFVTCLALSLQGWPTAHLSEPNFARSIGDRDWNDWNRAKQLDAALSEALRKRIPLGSSTAQLVDALNSEGFLAKQEHEGVCDGKYRGLVQWITGCINPEADLDRLTNAPFGAMYYYWGGLPCNWIMTAGWSADESKRVKTLSAEAYAVCL